MAGRACGGLSAAWSPSTRLDSWDRLCRDDTGCVGPRGPPAGWLVPTLGGGSCGLTVATPRAPPAARWIPPGTWRSAGGAAQSAVSVVTGWRAAQARQPTSRERAGPRGRSRSVSPRRNAGSTPEIVQHPEGRVAFGGFRDDVCFGGRPPREHTMAG